MVIAVADVLTRQGFDIGRHLYVDATDISPMCFRMTYLQAALRGIPATVRRGNTLSLEMFDHSVTPAFFDFYAIHKDRFDAWRHGTDAGTVGHDAAISQRDAESNAPEPEPVRAVAPAAQVRQPATKPRQLDLFG